MSGPTRECSSCGGTCHWHDTAWVCNDCGNEWDRDHDPLQYAAPRVGYRLCRECNNSIRVEEDGRLMPHFLDSRGYPGVKYCRGSTCSCPEPESNYRDEEGVLHQTVMIDGNCLAHGIHKEEKRDV